MKSNNAGLIYNILITKVNEYIDTIVLNKSLEDALKNTKRDEEKTTPSKIFKFQSELSTDESKAKLYDEKGSQFYKSIQNDKITLGSAGSSKQIKELSKKAKNKEFFSEQKSMTRDKSSEIERMLNKKYEINQEIIFLDIITKEYNISELLDDISLFNAFFNIRCTPQNFKEERKKYFNNSQTGGFNLYYFLQHMMFNLDVESRSYYLNSKEYNILVNKNFFTLGINKYRLILKSLINENRDLNIKINLLDFFVVIYYMADAFFQSTNGARGFSDPYERKIHFITDTKPEEFFMFIQDIPTRVTSTEKKGRFSLYTLKEYLASLNKKNIKKEDYSAFKLDNLRVLVNEDKINLYNSIGKKLETISRVAQFSKKVVEANTTDQKELFKAILSTFKSEITVFNSTQKTRSLRVNITNIRNELIKKDSEVTKGINKIVQAEIVKNAVKESLLNEIYTDDIASRLSKESIQSIVGNDSLVYYLIQDILQSITSRPMTTQQLLITFTQYASDIKNFLINTSNIKLLVEKLQPDYLEESGIKIIPLTNNRVNVTPNENNQFLFIKEEKITKDVSAAPTSASHNTGKTYLTQRYGLKKGDRYNDYYTINSLMEIQNPGQDFITDVSYFMINNPLFRISSRNELELSMFLNLMSTVEMSKCSPYLDMRLEIPSLLKINRKSININSVPSFLYGTENVEQEDQSLSSNSNFNSFTITKDNKRLQTSETNMSIFSMPQTLNNFDDTNFERRKKEGNNSFIRGHNVYDLTRPMMSLKSFTIDVAPTQGLMSFKTGKISLVLHDKSRMIEVSPFIKPDMFGAHGSELVVTYGWNNIESNFNKNLLGAFLNSKKVTEKYIITNSSFNITKNGEVNIDLSVAMRGPIDLKNALLEKESHLKIDFSPVETYYELIKETHRLIEAPNFSATTSMTQRYNSIDVDLFDYIYNFTKSFKTTKTKKAKKGEPSALTINEFYNDETSLIKSLLKSINKINQKQLDDFGKAILDQLTSGGGGSGPVDLAFQTITSSLILGINNFKNSYTESEAVSNLRFNIEMKNLISNMSGRDDLGSLLDDTIPTLKDLYTNFINSVIVYIKSVYAYAKSAEDFVDKIIRGIKNADPFYDRQLNQEIFGEGIVKITKKSDDPDNYVTLGSFITGVIVSHLNKLKVYDDIQIISYCANSNAALMSGKNLSSLLIKNEEINNILTDYYSDPEGTLTVEGFLSQVIQLINTNTNISYGLKSLYTISDEGVVSPVNEKAKDQQTALEAQLKKIYTEILKTKNESDPNATKFKRPKIRMSFDTMIGGELKDKTILRISIYDDNDNPFETVSDLFIKDNNNALLTAGSSLGKLYAQEKENIANKKSKTIVDKLISDGYIKVEDNNVTLTQKAQSLIPIKKEIKRNIPSITYGTQNSAVTEASVTTVNEAKLNTVYMTRSLEKNRQNAKAIQNMIDMPLQILPAQSSITMFGCPFVNFAQFMFLDFETGTTLDNIYAVTGIKHDLAPGRFMTTLTMSYGDIYGKYRNALELVQKAAEAQSSSTVRQKAKQTAQASATKQAQTQSVKSVDVSEYRYIIPREVDAYSTTNINNLHKQLFFSLFKEKIGNQFNATDRTQFVETQRISNNIDLHIYYVSVVDNNNAYCVITDDDNETNKINVGVLITLKKNYTDQPQSTNISFNSLIENLPPDKKQIISVINDSVTSPQLFKIEQNLNTTQALLYNFIKENIATITFDFKDPNETDEDKDTTYSINFNKEVSSSPTVSFSTSKGKSYTAKELDEIKKQIINELIKKINNFKSIQTNSSGNYNWTHNEKRYLVAINKSSRGFIKFVKGSKLNLIIKFTDLNKMLSEIIVNV